MRRLVRGTWSAAIKHTGIATLAITLTSCAVFDWLTAKPKPDPVWDPIGSVQQRWYVQLPNAEPGELKPDPLWTPNGVLVPASNGYLVALDTATGSKRWTAIAGPLAGARPVLRDGIVVIAENFGAAGVDGSTGAVRWRFEAPEDFRVSALNGSPGDRAYSARAHLGIDATTAYLPAWGGIVSAIDLTTGASRWAWRDTARLATPAGATGVVVSGDTVYVHEWNIRVRGEALSALWLVALRRMDGAELWRYKLPEDGYGAGPFAAPRVFGNLLIVRQFQRIVALDRFSRVMAWTFQEPNTFLANVEIALDGGRVYFAMNPADERLGIHIALDATTGVSLWRTVTQHSPDRDLVLSPTRVYSNHEAFITVLDKATGRLLVRVPPPVNPLGCGFLSSTTVGGGEVSVRIGCTGGSRNARVYTDFVWTFAEP